MTRSAGDNVTPASTHVTVRRSQKFEDRVTSKTASSICID
jgi:hypothetical protein